MRDGAAPDNRAAMELIAFLVDFILHVDKHLETFVANYGAWVYALLFLIIFVETGVVVMPFLPGRFAAVRRRRAVRRRAS